ncbi:hypothetical protein [Azospirillum himalayense]|uniref:Uncharacterized protein n=1 Tax=Azospirillum himalayense TaxID=654847 RepID=A0ABW0G7E4_9PROT
MPPRSRLIRSIAAPSIITIPLACPHTPRAEEPGAAFIAFQRWLHAADMAANDAATHEICGWGVIDLRTPFLARAIRRGVDATAWDDLAKRYDDASRERRYVEAMLTAHGANAPVQRIGGIHATGGCTDALRERVERQTAHDAP